MCSGIDRTISVRLEEQTEKKLRTQVVYATYIIITVAQYQMYGTPLRHGHDHRTQNRI